MRLNELPTSLISHIGKHLDLKDRRRCYQACKGMQCISWEFSHHNLKLTPTNCQELLANISVILNAIKRFKKHLKTLEIETFIDNTHVLGEFNNNDFENIDVQITIHWMENTHVDRVFDIFRNIRVSKMFLAIKHNSIIDPAIYSKLRGDHITVQISPTNSCTVLDLTVVPDIVDCIQLIVGYNTIKVMGADRVNFLYFTSNTYQAVHTLYGSFFQHKELPRLIEIGYLPSLPDEFPIEEESPLFSLLKRCPNLCKVNVFLHPNLVHDPSILPYVRCLASKVNHNNIRIRYYNDDGFVLATIINRITGLRIANYNSYKEPDELATAVKNTPLSGMNALFSKEHTKNCWCLLQST